MPYVPLLQPGPQDASLPSSASLISLVPRGLGAIPSTPSCVARSPPIDWFLFSAAIIIFCGTWWIFELGLSAEYGRHATWRGVTWHAFRVSAPASAAALAVKRSNNPTDWPSLYYHGRRFKVETNPRFLWVERVFHFTRAFLPEAFIVTAAILAIVRIGQSQLEERETLLLSLWFYAALSSPITGIVVCIASVSRIRNYGTIAITGLFIAVCLGAGYGAATQLTTAEDDDLETRIGIVLYVTMLIPWSLVPCCADFFHFCFLLINPIVRVIGFGVAIQAFKNNPDQFCTVNAPATTSAIVIAAVITGVCALVGYVMRDTWTPGLGDPLAPAAAPGPTAATDTEAGASAGDVVTSPSPALQREPRSSSRLSAVSDSAAGPSRSRTPTTNNGDIELRSMPPQRDEDLPPPAYDNVPPPPYKEAEPTVTQRVGGT